MSCFFFRCPWCPWCHFFLGNHRCPPWFLNGKSQHRSQSMCTMRQVTPPQRCQNDWFIKHFPSFHDSLFLMAVFLTQKKVKKVKYICIYKYIYMYMSGFMSNSNKWHLTSGIDYNWSYPPAKKGRLCCVVNSISVNQFGTCKSSPNGIHHWRPPLPQKKCCRNQLQS